jgi:hypothetical protein
VPFDEVKAEIQKRLSAERTSREYEAYLEGLRKQAIIDIRVREVPLQATVPAAKPLEIPEAPASDTEISTTPQSAPEHVVPQPRPSPSPSPRP